MRPLAGLRLLAAVLSLSVALVATAAPEPAPVDTITPAELDRLTTDVDPWHRSEIRRFYESRDWELAWLPRDRASAQAVAAALVLDSASELGLDPADYGSGWGARLVTAGGEVPADRARVDVAFSVALLRYVSDVQVGRVDPRAVGFDLESARGKLDLASILGRLVVDTNVAGSLAALDSPFNGYRKLKAALARYRQIERELGTVALDVKPTVEPGDPLPDAAMLARLLIALGDLPGSAALPDRAPVYSEDLVDGVRRFQTRHGLEADGRIGKWTLEELTRPLSHRVKQMELTLERWRWVPRSLRAPLAVVNIPAYELYAFDGPGDPTFSMKVVVGRAALTPTPVTTGTLQQVIFQPEWNVPRSILVNEIIPKIDAGYLASRNMEIVDGSGRAVPLDERSLGGLRAGTHRVRQRPGPDNALGPVKFNFGNTQAIYLHGTPAVSGFAKPRRDFSHGCIRLESPADLAEWLLSDQPAWTRVKVDDAMSGSRTIAVRVTRETGILILYGTVIVTPSGQVRFFDDVYEMDERLDAALRR